jgi:hypothetical protein
LLKLKNYIVIIVFFSSLCCTSANAQDVLTKVANGEDVNVVYKDMALGGAFMHPEGWGLFYRKAKILTIYKKWFYEIETSSMHSDKEVKIQNEGYPDASSYDYGKLNDMQVFRFGTGYYRTLWRKNNEHCVEIDAVYSAGLSLAVLKPVYLQVLETPPNNPTDPELDLVTRKYDPLTDTPNNIYGSASGFDGIGELAFYPGAYGRFGFNFDYAGRHDLIKAIETGFEIDGYLQKIPIMAPQFVQNNQFFFNFYVSISFGKRWF